jgi:hypothetical protein
MKNRIVIYLHPFCLNKQAWGILHSFIDGFYKENVERELFYELKYIADVYASNDSLNRYIDSAIGTDLIWDNFPSPKDVFFNIIYKKEDKKRNFSSMIPFYFLHKDFGGNVLLGIDINVFEDDTEKDAYIFSISTLLYPFYKGDAIYLICNGTIVNKETGEIIPYNHRKLSNIPERDASRYIFPLILINTNTFLALFKNGEPSKISHVLQSIGKMNNELPYGLCNSANDKQIVFRSIFEEWFIKAYFVSLANSDREGLNSEELASIMPLLRVYSESIKELAENIVFHTNDKEGLLYVIFQKGKNLASNYADKLSINSPKNDSMDRYVEIGILDNNDKGIVDMYLAKEKMVDAPALVDFFDEKRIHTQGFDHLYLRYAAHLGIKTFATTIRRHNGYFYVESNKSTKKETIEYQPQSQSEPYKQEELISYFCNGTHYEIIFPIVENDKEEKTISPHIVSFQTNTFLEQLKNALLSKESLQSVVIPKMQLINNGNFIDKKGQEEAIELLATKMLQNQVDRRISINMKNCDFNDVGLLFKIIARMQIIRGDNFLTHIIFFNMSNGFVDEICNRVMSLLIMDHESGEKRIWSNDSAIILISDTLRWQIISGETKELLGYLNYRLSRFYSNENVFADYYDGQFEITDEVRGIEQKYVLPYDLLIDNGAIFKEHVKKVLYNPIGNQDIGCKVDHENTRIGRKVIIKNFYEADYIFQNSFFTERFAYVIAKNIIKWKGDDEQKIILIGYKSYSRFIVRTVKDFLDHYYSQHDNITNIVENIVTANENEDGTIHWDSDNEDPLGDISKFKFAIIVPIGTTLTTNDKIISLYFSHLKISPIPILNSLYNYCGVVVRDKIAKDPTELEKKMCWVQIGNEKISTTFRYATEVHYSIDVADGEDCNNWLSRLDERFYPRHWYDEMYVNDTHNSSLNSQNLMGYPMVRDLNPEQYEMEYKRIEELKNYIYFGHIIAHHFHFRFYIDTERFVRERKPNNSFSKWVKDLAGNKNFSSNNLNVIITPNINIQSDFVELLREEVFKDNAIVITIDTDDWRDNVMCKFSFLKESNFTHVKYHYIDHALLTSETYSKTISYMMSILNRSGDFKFENIISIVNRLAYDRYQEIENSGVKIFSFINLFIPPSIECSLCKMKEHYKYLQMNTVLETCKKVICDYEGELIEKEFHTIKRDSKQVNAEKERLFRELLLTHKLSYKISNMHRKQLKKADIESALDSMYTELDNETDCEISFLRTISSPPLSYYINMRIYALKKLLTELKILFDSTQNNFYNIRKLISILEQLSFFNSNALVREEVILNTWQKYFNYNKLISELNDNEVSKKRAESLIEISEKAKIMLEDAIYHEQHIQDDIFPTNIVSKENRIRKHNNRIKKYIKKIEQFNKVIEELRVDCGITNEEPMSHLEKMTRFFQSRIQLYLKTVTSNDETKSMWIGELLRTGHEQNLDSKSTISKTEPNNQLFSHFNEQTDKRFYSEFLVWAFYDNTTIIRKTLGNFEDELNKDPNIRNGFFDEKDKLKDFDTFKQRKDYVIEKVTEKIQTEYYYANFKKYLNNPDGINFVEKLLYVLYAKRKLSDMIGQMHKTNIETDMSVLLNIFSSIMDATASFFCMKKDDNEKETYMLSSVGIKDLEPSKIAKSDNYYSDLILRQAKSTYKYFPYPLIINHKIFPDDGENKLGNFDRLNLLLIEDDKKEENVKGESVPIASITFLYNTNDSIDIDEFRMKSMEYCRLLLLLKDEFFNKYVANYLLKEKVFDLWIEKNRTQQMNKDFIARYRQNSHEAGARLSDMERSLFNNKNGLWDFPNLYAVASDLCIGDIHYALLSGNDMVYEAQIRSINESIEQNFFDCMRNYLIKKGFSAQNIQISYDDYKEKMIYYSSETPLILFQLINNIIAHTQDKASSRVSITIENAYMTFSNSHAKPKPIEQLREIIEGCEIPRKSISLYCINYYMLNMCDKADKKIDIQVKDNNFIVKIPIIYNNQQ